MISEKMEVVGYWRTDEPPKDESRFLGCWECGCFAVVSWNPIDESWILDPVTKFKSDDPIAWAQVFRPEDQQHSVESAPTALDLKVLEVQAEAAELARAQVRMFLEFLLRRVEGLDGDPLKFETEFIRACYGKAKDDA